MHKTTSNVGVRYSCTGNQFNSNALWLSISSSIPVLMMASSGLIVLNVADRSEGDFWLKMLSYKMFKSKAKVPILVEL